jgi:hypothetical protein
LSGSEAEGYARGSAIQTAGNLLSEPERRMFHTRVKWVVLVLISTIVLACAIDTANPFKTFMAEELVGTWRAEYKNFEFRYRGYRDETITSNQIEHISRFMMMEGLVYVESLEQMALERGRICI